MADDQKTPEVAPAPANNEGEAVPTLAPAIPWHLQLAQRIKKQLAIGREQLLTANANS
jgi:hypothetical protein